MHCFLGFFIFLKIIIVSNYQTFQSFDLVEDFFVAISKRRPCPVSENDDSRNLITLYPVLLQVELNLLIKVCFTVHTKQAGYPISCTNLVMNPGTNSYQFEYSWLQKDILRYPTYPLCGMKVEKQGYLSTVTEKQSLKQSWISRQNFPTLFNDWGSSHCSRNWAFCF